MSGALRPGGRWQCDRGVSKPHEEGMPMDSGGKISEHVCAREAKQTYEWVSVDRGAKRDLLTVGHVRRGDAFRRRDETAAIDCGGIPGVRRLRGPTQRRTPHRRASQLGNSGRQERQPETGCVNRGRHWPTSRCACLARVMFFEAAWFPSLSPPQTVRVCD